MMQVQAGGIISWNILCIINTSSVDSSPWCQIRNIHGLKLQMLVNFTAWRIWKHRLPVLINLVSFSILSDYEKQFFELMFPFFALPTQNGTFKAVVPQKCLLIVPNNVNQRSVPGMFMYVFYIPRCYQS